jgi:hypothetical protein
MHEPHPSPQPTPPGPPPAPPAEARPEPRPEPAAPREDAADDGPRPLGVGVRPTGHDAVDARLRRLADADLLAVSAHPEIYEEVHRGLRDTLAALDRPDGPPAPGPRS